MSSHLDVPDNLPMEGAQEASLQEPAQLEPFNKFSSRWPYLNPMEKAHIGHLYWRSNESSWG